MKAQGLEYIENLGDYVKHNHGRIFTETTAEKLIKEGNQVVGIEARKANGAKVKIHTSWCSVGYWWLWSEYKNATTI